ncbi:MAG: type VI secretion system protein TssA, partial [Luteibacter sp.]
MSTPTHPLPPASIEHGYFEAHLRVSLERLLAPIHAREPAGTPARGMSVYRVLAEARRGDDASLPMGAWERDLRRADWPKASHLAAAILAETSKDLQVAAWLLEAEIHQRGYAAVAPCVALMQGLCESFMERLHPHSDDGSFDALGNVIRWTDEKLLPTLALVPMAGEGERTVVWADLERARRYERVRATLGTRTDDGSEGRRLAELAALLEREDTDRLRARIGELEAARAAVQSFEARLREQANDMPSLPSLRGLLERLQGPLREEIARRGLTVAEPVVEVVVEPMAQAAVGDDPHAETGDAVPDGTERDDERDDAPMDMIAERRRAYAVLQDIAEFLARIEPHSPVPYLLRRAVLWGELNS